MICTITALGSHNKKPLPVAISKHTIGKRSKHCQYSLDNQKSGSNMSGKRTGCWQYVEIWWIFFMEQSPVWGAAEEGGCVVCSDRQTGYRHFLFLLDYNHKNWIIVFIMLFLFLSFLFELEWEWRCVNPADGHDGWILAADGWLLLYLARQRRIPVWACWRALCP